MGHLADAEKVSSQISVKPLSEKRNQRSKQSNLVIVFQTLDQHCRLRA